MVVSVHIPKSAGTSFRWVLQGLYGERVWFDYGRIFHRGQALPGIIPAGTQCIHGHFLADAFDRLYPRRKLITWVRHPVERVAATYHHFLRQPDMRDDCCRALYERKLSIREFSDLDWMCNTATRYLAAKPIGDFAFVGVVERFDECVRRFATEFGGSVRAIPRQNVNRERTTTHYDLPPEIFEHILSRNAADMEWYDKAVGALTKPLEPVL
ncbi:MAG TPA: hypothetical protein VGL42_17100 [Opitutaceae bacterium]